MADFLERWANQNEANAKLVAQEILITDVTEAIWKAIEETGITKADLAEKMGTTKSHVSQVLNGSRNMTLRTLADICFGLECEPTFHLEQKSQTNKWESIRYDVFSLKPSKVRYRQAGNVITPVNGWKEAA
jgi:transcriptional regulator with XRE-family HTH domain